MVTDVRACTITTITALHLQFVPKKKKGENGPKGHGLGVLSFCLTVRTVPKKKNEGVLFKVV